MNSAAEMPWLTPTLQSILSKAGEQRLAHATLVTGPKGIGKLRCLQSAAASLLCESLDACGKCKSCELIASGSHPDLLLLKPEEEGKALKVDAIRAVGDFAQRSSHAGGARIIILNQAHALNVNASNALLKTLEEPNEQTFMFLVSDQPGLLSATIRSRCQILQVQIPTQEVSLSWMKRRIEESNEAEWDAQQASEALQSARGGPLWALDLLQNGTPSQAKAIRRELRAVLAAQSDAASLLTALLAATPLDAVELLVSETSELAKAILAAGHDEPLGEPLKTQVKQNPAHYARRILTLHEEFEIARRQLSSVSNPNPKLLLESLSYLTSRAFR